MSNVAVLVGSGLNWIWNMLTIAERTWGGLAHPEKIEEMDKELTRVIEEFDRAVNVEALRQIRQTRKHLLFSMRRWAFLSGYI
jgi:hypothetical protein